MRRLVSHAIAGLGCAAFAATVAVAGLSSPAADQQAAAGPVTSVALPSEVASAVSAAAAAARDDQAGELTRSANRAAITAAAARTAAQRSAALDKASRSITQQQEKLRTAETARKAKAVARAKAAADAKAAAAKARVAKAAADAAAKKAAAAKAKKAAAAKAKKAAAAKAKKAAQAKAVAKQRYTAGTADPKSMARQILQSKYGYGADQFSCFNNIIMRESAWDIHATNAGSGAYGIPQALPGSKMATVASDWRTNPATQIIWGVQYMKGRYGSPCGAWGFKSSHGWY